MSRNKHHEWWSEEMASLVEFIDESELLDTHKENFAELAQMIDSDLDDEPIESLITLLESTMQAFTFILEAAQSARVDEILDSPDPCEGHKETE